MTSDDPQRGLPDDIAQEAERLTRLARRTPDDNETAAYRKRRDQLLTEHGYTARLREDDGGAILVLHPAAWLEDGRVRIDQVNDTDRAREISLEGPGDADDWETVEEHNRSIARQVASEHGPIHGANAHAFADYMGNHYARPIEEATGEQVNEFLEEYFPRNAWPDQAQRAIVEESLDHIFQTADIPDPFPEDPTS